LEITTKKIMKKISEFLQEVFSPKKKHINEENVPKKQLEIVFFEKTDIGVKKSTLNNEDWVGNFMSDNGHAFVLCDGLGGHRAGEVASALAGDIVKKCFTRYAYLNTTTALEDCFEQANSTVFKASVQYDGLMGMGTTMVMAVVKDEKVYYAHAGDSRLYHYVAKEKALHQKTKDDVTTSEHYKGQEFISNAIGIEEFIKPNIHEPITPSNKDIIMLCSDGLFNMITPEKLLEVLTSEISITEKGDLLVDMANATGGDDNISVQLIEFL